MIRFSLLFAAASSPLSGAALVSQVHLSLPGDGAGSMGLDYVSDAADVSVVEFCIAEEQDSCLKVSSQNLFLENIGFLHNVVLEPLQEHAVYNYRVGTGSDELWSQWYTFSNGPYSRQDFSRLGESGAGVAAGGVGAIYADLGVYNGLSIGRLQKEAAQGIYDYAVHIGDIAYDLYSDNSSVGNEYMTTMSSITAQYPLMIGEGNHEKGDNFTEYNRRFKAIESLAGKKSKSNSNHYYSFNVGLIHYVMLSTEVYSYPAEAADGPSPFSAQDQLDWLEADLTAANEKEAREKVPWIVLMGHRPWYTVEMEGIKKIDDLACRYGVDLYFTGHVHNYQRWLPMRLASPFIPDDVDKECISEGGHKYINPKYMPTIVAGSTGCHSPEPRVACPVMKVGSELLLDGALADCSAAYGFGHLQAVNKTHLYWEFVQSHRAASIMGPTDENHMFDSADSFLSSERDMKDIFDFYGDAMRGKGVSRDSFASTLKRAVTDWVEDESSRDNEVQRNEKSQVPGGSRLVRDYLWMEQSVHGMRDYC